MVNGWLTATHWQRWGAVLENRGYAMTNTPDDADDKLASNRKPADHLHELREQMRILKAEEKQLRERFISGDLPRDGDDYTVTVDVKPNERIDLEQMRQHVPESIWKPFLIEKPVVYV